MTKLNLDSGRLSKLRGLDGEVEVCDNSGKTVGRYLPEDAYQKMLYAAVIGACPFTTEELDRRRKEGGGRTLAEIWKSLGRR